MTPEEVFEQLRDVHLPRVDSAVVAGLDPRPLVIFAVAVAGLWLVRQILRRRTAVAGLKTDPATMPSDQRDQIVRAMRRRARRKDAAPVPQAAFVEPEQVSRDDVRDLRRWASRRLR